MWQEQGLSTTQWLFQDIYENRRKLRYICMPRSLPRAPTQTSTPASITVRLTLLTHYFSYLMSLSPFLYAMLCINNSINLITQWSLSMLSQIHQVDVSFFKNSCLFLWFNAYCFGLYSLFSCPQCLRIFPHRMRSVQCFLWHNHMAPLIMAQEPQKHRIHYHHHYHCCRSQRVLQTATLTLTSNLLSHLWLPMSAIASWSLQQLYLSCYIFASCQHMSWKQ